MKTPNGLPGLVLASLWACTPQPPNLAQGKELYDARCASCHGPDGRGAALDFDLLTFQFRIQTLQFGGYRTNDQLRQRIEEGYPVLRKNGDAEERLYLMPPKGLTLAHLQEKDPEHFALQPHEYDALILYVQHLIDHIHGNEQPNL